MEIHNIYKIIFAIPPPILSFRALRGISIVITKEILRYTQNDRQLAKF